MNERNPQMSPEAQEPGSGLPQDLMDELMVLAQEVRAVEAKAARGWKVALAGWVIFLVVVFSYLYFGVYRAVIVPIFEPGTLVQMGMGLANGALEKQGLPEVGSAEFASRLADRLEVGIPALVQQQLKPQLIALQEQLPERRIELTQKFRANAPQIMDDAVDYFEGNMLPRLHDTLLTTVGERVDEVLERVDETIGEAVTQVIVTHWDSMAVVGPDQMSELREGLANTFEQQMGPVLDEMFKGTDESVAEVRREIEKLVERYKSQTLTADDMRVIRLIQLCLALFKSMKEAPPEVQESIYDQFMSQLRDLGIGAAAREQIGREVQAGVTPDLSDLSPEEREAAMKAFKESQRLAAEAQAQGTRSQAAPDTDRPAYGHRPPTGPVQQPQIPTSEEEARRADAAARSGQ